MPLFNNIDLARMLVDLYSEKYIGHTRLEKIVEKNNMLMKDFLKSETEAAAFNNKEYVKLH